MNIAKTTPSPKNNIFLNYLLIVGVLIITIGISSKIAITLLQENITSFVRESKIFSDTGLIVINALPIDICIIGASLIIIILSIKVLLRYETSVEKYYRLLTENAPAWISQYKNYLLLGTLVITTFFLFHQALDCFFIRDDFANIFAARVEPWQAIFRINQFFWRPLSLLYFRIMSQTFGLDPVAFHWGSIILHILNGLLVFWMVLLLSQEKLLAFLASIIFVSRFALFYAVFWTGVQDTFMAIFFLLAIIYYLKAKQNNYYLIPSVICCIGAFMTKEMAASLPLLLLAYELTIALREHSLKTKFTYLLKRQTIYFVVLLGYLSLRFLKSNFAKAALGSGRGGSTMYTLEIGKNTLSHVINYTRFSFNSAGDPATILVIAFICFGLCYWKTSPSTLLKRKETSLFLYGTSWFFLALSPVLFIWHVSKHYMYVPVIGFSIAIASLVLYFFNKIQEQHFALARIFVIVFIVGTCTVGYAQIYQKAAAKEGFLKVGEVARTFITYFRKKYPQLPKGAKLYFIPHQNVQDVAGTKQYHWDVTDEGFLFRLFYQDGSIKSIYSTKEELNKLQLDDKTFVFAYDRENLYDLTPSFVPTKQR